MHATSEKLKQFLILVQVKSDQDRSMYYKTIRRVIILNTYLFGTIERATAARVPRGAQHFQFMSAESYVVAFVDENVRLGTTLTRYDAFTS